jgi:hypothetical protein
MRRSDAELSKVRSRWMVPKFRTNEFFCSMISIGLELP